MRYIVYCSSGYRSLIGASILRANGINAVDLFGGFAAISVYAPELTTTEKVLLIHIIFIKDTITPNVTKIWIVIIFIYFTHLY